MTGIYFTVTENVAKGSGDRPTVDIIVAECGEVSFRQRPLYISDTETVLPLQLPVETVADQDGKQVPLRAEL